MRNIRAIARMKIEDYDEIDVGDIDLRQFPSLLSSTCPEACANKDDMCYECHKHSKFEAILV